MEEIFGSFDEAQSYLQTLKQNVYPKRLPSRTLLNVPTAPITLNVDKLAPENIGMMSSLLSGINLRLWDDEEFKTQVMRVTDFALCERMLETLDHCRIETLLNIAIENSNTIDSPHAFGLK